MRALTPKSAAAQSLNEFADLLARAISTAAVVAETAAAAGAAAAGAQKTKPSNWSTMKPREKENWLHRHPRGL